MRKAAHPSGGMGSSKPRHWRGKRLQHHGDVVCHGVCAFCAASDSWLISRTRRAYIIEVLQSEPPRLAPYHMWKAAHPLCGVDSSNPHCWRGWRLHHHGGGVCCVFVLCVAVSSGCCHLSYLDKYVPHNVLHSDPPRLAPHHWFSVTG